MRLSCVCNCVRALQWTPQQLSTWICWQGSRQKAAQTSSVAARPTAVQPSPQDAAERVPAGLRPALTRSVPRAGPLRTRRFSLGVSLRTVIDGLPTVELSQARNLLMSACLQADSQSRVAPCAVAHRTRHSDHSARKAGLDRVCGSATRPATKPHLTCDVRQISDPHSGGGHPRGSPPPSG